MDIIQQIYTLLEQKKQAFDAYEAATEALLQCEADSVEHYITQREQLASKIDGLNAEIRRLCAEDTAGAALENAAFSRLNYDDMPAEHRPLYELDQQTRTILYRIGEANPKVVERLEQFRKEAEEHMRNNENVPKIKKYLTDLGGGDNFINLKDEKV